MASDSSETRRRFLQAAVAGGALAGGILLTGCQSTGAAQARGSDAEGEDENDEKMAPGEDLMQMNGFISMYEPHEAREDTALFPAFRDMLNKREYDALGEQFEKEEHKHFGADGFDIAVDQIAPIEKSLGIYDLAQFTPKI